MTKNDGKLRFPKLNVDLSWYRTNELSAINSLKYLLKRTFALEFRCPNAESEGKYNHIGSNTSRDCIYNLSTKNYISQDVAVTFLYLSAFLGRIDLAKPKTGKSGHSYSDRICNLTPSHGTEKDWQFQNAAQAGIFAAPAALPAGVDLRAPWWDIGDQENTGSCVGWGSTDGVARYTFVKAGRLGQAEKLSPRFTWMASKETDQFTTRPETMIESAGTTLKAAVDILRNYGAVPEALLPFHINTAMYSGDENTFYATAATRKISAYFNLQRNLPNWRAWLAAHGPLLVGLNVDHSWDNATATRGNIDEFQANTVRGGHAVTLVGYRADGRFIVRNSWGTAWGDKGFGYPSESYINAAFYSESYGVSL